MKTLFRLAVLVSSAALLAAACRTARPTAPASVPTPAAAATKKLSSFDPTVNALLAKMTLEEKIGQMTHPEQDKLGDLANIQKYFLGSLFSGGSSDPQAGNSMQAWAEMYDRYQAEALKTRLAIPLLYGVDAVHGHSNVIGAVIFPHNVGLGCTRNPALLEKIGRITAAEMRATGVNFAYSPCVAVPRDVRWGRTYEGFGESPDLVKSFGGPSVRGLQGPDLGLSTGVLACAKHYMGDGGTTWGTGTGAAKGVDQGDTRLDEASLKALHMQGYVTAIAAGVGSIMPSYSSWNGVKVSGSRDLLTRILKEELGFEGFLVSDYNALDQLPGDHKTQIETSINAGMDMVMAARDWIEFYDTLKALVNEGRVPMSRIDDAVRRILRVKFAMGLMDKSRSTLSDKALQATFGSAEHRQVARQAVRESIVLLKNEKHALPAKKTLKRILVAGKNADDIGNQCGGWTIDWQGRSGNVTTGGTTILQAIKQAVSKDTEVVYDKGGSGAAGADLGIVVVGEKPYAEMMGDRNDLALDAEDVAAIDAVKKQGIPVVVVLLSGRPMIIDQAIGKADAFVAAWLPGTEGQGVADVLFGDYKPTGKLSHSWPSAMSQIPINVGDASYAPLFKYGFGLSY
jgi:beta-glucosidase